MKIRIPPGRPRKVVEDWGSTSAAFIKSLKPQGWWPHLGVDKCFRFLAWSHLTYVGWDRIGYIRKSRWLIRTWPTSRGWESKWVKEIWPSQQFGNDWKHHADAWGFLEDVTLEVRGSWRFSCVPLPGRVNTRFTNLGWSIWGTPAKMVMSCY